MTLPNKEIQTVIIKKIEYLKLLGVKKLEIYYWKFYNNPKDPIKKNNATFKIIANLLGLKKIKGRNQKEHINKIHPIIKNIAKYL